jgi:predicted aspartyl protease
MIFYYQSIISAAPDDDDYLLVLRPEIPLTVFGPGGKGTYTALVDTGSDHTILPKSIADVLQIPIRAASGTPATAFGGHRVQLFVGEVTFELTEETEVLRWSAQAYFFDFAEDEDECVILGHSGFLDYFTATFDGKQGILTLIANDELPATS